MQAGYPKIQFVFIVVLCTHKNVTSIKKLAFLLLFSRASKSAPIESKAWRESSIAWLAARGFCRCFGVWIFSQSILVQYMMTVYSL